MNDGIRILSDYQSWSRFSRRLIITGVIAIAAALTGVFAIYMRDVRRNAERIYILDEGSVLSAARAENGVQKDLEVISHSTRFHELFFNMAPNINTINQNVDRALELADASAYDYYSDLKEQQYFTRLIQANATQQMVVDSVRVDVTSYPYRARTYASVFLIRESTITRYDFVSQCSLKDVTRTMSNPHGLMIEKFHVEKYDILETRARK